MPTFIYLNMKKNLLIVLSILPAYLFAQSNTKVVNPNVNVPHSSSPVNSATDQTYFPYTAGSVIKPDLYKKHPGYSAVVIGKTFYDLQTNASIGRRVILHDESQVSAVWTTSPIGEANWPTRGIGYNHKKTSWPDPVNNRLESQRTGWPSIGILENAGNKYEFVMGHVSSTGGWILSKNTAIGNPTFGSETTVLQQLNNKVSIWGRAATNNKNIIHVVSNYYASTAEGIPVVKINGVSSPTTYCRSTNSGLTWDKQFIAMPGYDSTRTLAGGGDNYAIDVKDSIVAIVIGGTGEDVVLYKSTNNGNSFNKIVVEEFEFAPFSKKFIPNATPAKTADGSFDVIIGNDNKAHVFFGRMFVSDEDTTDDSYSFYPGTAQLVHWSEGWDSVNICGLAKDYDQNGTLDVTRETTSFLDANGGLPAGVTSATRYGSTALVSFPSSSMDDNGNLYVIYSAPHELAISPFNANYRDIYVSYSKNGGQTWTIGQNITATAFGLITNKENVFASAAKRCDNFLHLIYQEDELPGTNLQNNGNSNTHPNDEQRIMYRAVPVADILSNTVGDPVSVKKVTADPKIFFVSQNQPNPFNSETNAMIYMRDGSDLTLTVSDITGKVVRTEGLGYHGAGNHSITINADGLNSGLYLYTLTNKQYGITKKMQVK